MKKIVSNFIVILLLVSACSDETELKKSVFVPDDDFPDLPAYTEWGYNTFGAYYERTVFVSAEHLVPAKFINTGGVTSFSLKGSLRQTGYNYYLSANEMLLIFDFYSFDPHVYTDLISLNNVSIDLTGSNLSVRATIGTEVNTLQILNGILEFKRAQNLYVDKSHVEVILSGTFSFQAIVGGEPVSVTHGRFDVGISQDNFFRY